MRYDQIIYYPPFERHSLLLQVTCGCSYNQCAFCNMYKTVDFEVIPMKQIIADLRDAAGYNPYTERVFLVGGEPLCLPFEQMRQILQEIRHYLPYCACVSMYASIKNLRDNTVEQLRELHRLGLGFLYIGLESGSDALLKRYNKGETAAEIVEGGLKVRDAGLALSVTAINGMGGVELWQPHAIDTAKALSAMKPEYIGLLTLRVYQGTPLAKWVQEGTLTQLDPLQLAAETRLLLEHIDSEGSVFRSNHASNYLVLRGTLNRDKPALIRQIDAALAGKQPFRKYVELGF